MRRLLIALFLPLFLANCAEPVWAPDDAVARARYVPDEGLDNLVHRRVRKLGGEGAHSGIMINGSQRVLFNPPALIITRMRQNATIFSMALRHR